MIYDTIEKRTQYYTDPKIQQKIAYNCRYREVVIIKKPPERRPIVVRPLKIFKPEHFDFWFRRLHLDRTEFDIYISNASVKLPPLPNNLNQLKEAQKMLIQQWEDIMTGYDLFVDIDPRTPDDEELCLSWAKKIKYLLQRGGFGKKQPIEIWKTGSGGVHLILKGRFYPELCDSIITEICCHAKLPMRRPFKTEKGKRYIAQDGEWVEFDGKNMPIIERPFVDNTIYDSRRIRRVPYSIHSKTGRPMTPFIDNTHPPWRKSGVV